MATPGALNAFAATGENPINYIVRHMNLDPGVLAAANQLANLQAVRESTRVFSAYELPDGTRIWIITEADRFLTEGAHIRPTICRLRKGETIGGHGH
jgi:hypothetical protein